MNRSHLVRSLALVGLFAACASKPPPDAHRPVEEEALDLHGAAKDDAGSSTPSSTSGSSASGDVPRSLLGFTLGAHHSTMKVSELPNPVQGTRAALKDVTYFAPTSAVVLGGITAQETRLTFYRDQLDDVVMTFTTKESCAKVLAELRALVKVAPTMTDPGKDLPRVYWHGKNGAYLSFEPNASHVDATCEVSLADNALQAAAINNDPNVEPYHR